MGAALFAWLRAAFSGGSVNAPAAELPPLAWIDVRCRKCKFLLCKTTPQALREDGLLEIKCSRSRCKALNQIDNNEVREIDRW